MEAILIKSVEKREALFAADGYHYLITAELRVFPMVSGNLSGVSGCHQPGLARKIVKAGLTDLVGQSEDSGFFYLTKFSKKEFLQSATISNIVEAFQKEEADLQAEFTKLMDQALIADKLNAVSQGDKQ